MKMLHLLLTAGLLFASTNAAERPTKRQKKYHRQAAPGQLVDLSEQLVTHLAAYLPAKDLASFTATARKYKHTLANHLQLVFNKIAYAEELSEEPRRFLAQMLIQEGVSPDTETRKYSITPQVANRALCAATEKHASENTRTQLWLVLYDAITDYQKPFLEAAREARDLLRPYMEANGRNAVAAALQGNAVLRASVEDILAADRRRRLTQRVALIQALNPQLPYLVKVALPLVEQHYPHIQATLDGDPGAEHTLHEVPLDLMNGYRRLAQAKIDILLAILPDRVSVAITRSSLANPRIISKNLLNLTFDDCLSRRTGPGRLAGDDEENPYEIERCPMTLRNMIAPSLGTLTMRDNTFSDLGCFLPMLTTLDIQRGFKLTTLASLKAPSIESLTVQATPIKRLSLKLPRARTIRLEETDLETLEGLCAPALETLSVSNSSELVSLNHCPPSVTTLHANSCSLANVMVSLPNVRTLSLNYNHHLQTLAGLEADLLEELFVNNCKLVVTGGRRYPNLRVLEAANNPHEITLEHLRNNTFFLAPREYCPQPGEMNAPINLPSR